MPRRARRASRNLRGFVLLCAPVLALAIAQQGNAGTRTAAATAEGIACRAMEVHVSAQPSVTAVLFHQRDRSDQARFAELLKQEDGKVAQIRVGQGIWRPAYVARLKDCFGRGLLLAPSGLDLKDGEEFELRSLP